MTVDTKNGAKSRGHGANGIGYRVKAGCQVSEDRGQKVSLEVD